MKKLLLTLAGAALLSSAFAQTHADLSGNLISDSDRGVVFEFKGTSANNCYKGGGVQFYADIASQSWAVGNGTLDITVPTLTAYDDTRQAIKFYSGDCVAANIDLSNTADQK